VANLNYHHLRYFRAIAHDGGIARAAARLRVAASALSLQLAALETQLGHRLFDRQGRRLVLTEAGRIALDYADTVFAAGDELVDTLAGRSGAARAILRVGAVSTLSRNFQLGVLQPLVGRADVELVVQSGPLADLLARLDALNLDIVLANTAADPGRGLASRLIDEQPVSLVGRPGPLLRFPDDLAGVALLLPGADSGFRRAFDRRLESAGVVPAIAAEVDDMAMLRLLARESDGLALVPGIVVRDELATGALVERCRIDGLAERFYAITAPRRFPNPLLHTLFAEGGEAARRDETAATAPPAPRGTLRRPPDTPSRTDSRT
jgi:LysR family transcriptional regulator, transcriptional activator of nhaA